VRTLQQIADALEGYDPSALPIRQARTFLEALVAPLDQIDEVPLIEAGDRILARDLVSGLDVPPHDNSAMDGYAFRGVDLSAGDQTLSLEVVGTALAGRAWTGRIEAGQCVRIMTGAIMPAGLDTVVPQEMVQADDTGRTIRFPTTSLRAGDNRRFKGEDLRIGAVALRRGQRIGPARLGLAASLGIESLPVYRRPVVACLSTGDEIAALGEPLREGSVYDSNRYSLMGLLRRLGCKVVDLGLIPDDPARLRTALERAADQADVVISSGGVSVGQADHTRVLLDEVADMVFWRVAMRPGRPLAAGRVQRPDRARPTLVFGLPGNPVAVMVTFMALVRPTLLKLMGCADEPPPLLQARSLTALQKKPGRTEYQRGWVSIDPQGQLQVRVTGNQGSGVLSSMTEANGLIVLPHESGSVKPGDAVEVMMFEGYL
jgi:molybdopterin molybdotransferase